jgi:hypothetical protein
MQIGNDEATHFQININAQKSGGATRPIAKGYDITRGAQGHPPR